MDQAYVNTVVTFMQQKVADSMLEAANLQAQLNKANARIAELESAGKQGSAAPEESPVDPVAKK